MRLTSILLNTLAATSVLIASHTVALAQTIKFGVTAGPHAQIAEAIVPVAKAKGLDIQVVEFSDGALIDPATNDGDLDANGFQHTPYLNRQNADRGLNLVAVGGRTVLLPMAGYSRKYKSVAELPEGAQVTIPNDPSNLGRALKLLEAGGVIKLKPGLTFNATELDITENPKKIKILPLETAQLPRSLEDVDFSVHHFPFRPLGRSQPQQGWHPDRRQAVGILLPDRRGRKEQGCAMGEDLGRILQVAGSEGLHRKDLRRQHRRRLVR